MSAETWTSELESKGSVVFLPRRGRLAIRLAGFALLMAVRVDEHRPSAG
ncbi:hypothetical protein OHA10_02665 [Kribbella sp. NBC_00662]